MKSKTMIQKLAICSILLIAFLCNNTAFAQIAVTTDGTAPDESAMLDVKSTDKGVLFPRLTQTEIEDIETPANGLIVFNTDDNRLYFYDEPAGEWKEIAIGSGTITPGGEQWTCGDDPLIDARDDDRSYATVQIGTQCWMAENLNIGSPIAGTTNQTDNSTIEKYCYGDDDANCTTYGGLYQWNEMMQYVASGAGVQGICPDGWHIPTDGEWKTMEMQLGMSQSQADTDDWRGTDEGEKMKSTSGWYDNGNGTNISLFTALPGGYRYTDDDFYGLDHLGYWWSATANGSTYAWGRLLSYSTDKVSRYSLNKESGFSVRCLRD